MAKRCILQVEDEETDVLLLRHAFQRAGISQALQVVTCAKEALEYLSGEGRFADRQSYPFPDLVLLDLKLPDTNGLEILAWMRRQTQLKTTVVVALTSSNHETDIRRAYELGVNSYVVKAADQQKRFEFAQHLKGWWLGCNEYPPTALSNS